eukprot:RCo047815
MRSHPAKKKGYVGVYADSRRFEEADEVSFTFNLPFEVDYGSMNSPALEVFSSRGTLLRDSKGEAPPAYSKDVLIFVRGLKVEDITGLTLAGLGQDVGHRGSHPLRGRLRRRDQPRLPVLQHCVPGQGGQPTSSMSSRLTHQPALLMKPPLRRAPTSNGTHLSTSK